MDEIKEALGPGRPVDIQGLYDILSTLQEGDLLYVKGIYDRKEILCVVTFPLQESISNVYHIGILPNKRTPHPSTMPGSITLWMNRGEVEVQRTMSQQVQPLEAVSVDAKAYYLTEGVKTMKLTKDYYIEGQVFKAGSEIKIEEGIEAKLIGKWIYKPESKKQGLIVKVEPGMLPDLITVTFSDGTKAGYPKTDIKNLLVHGQGIADMYLESQEGINESVAETILDQLGGSNRLNSMIGAEMFMSGKNSDGTEYLTFRFPKGKQGINIVKITLNGKDLYDIEYAKFRGTNYDVVKTSTDLLAGQLKDDFETTTGLYLSL